MSNAFRPPRAAPGCAGDDRRGDRRLVQQPGQGQITGFVAELLGEVLVRAELLAVLLQALGQEIAVAALPVTLLAHRAAEQTRSQRAPRDHADAKRLRGRQNLQLDLAGEQVVVRLFADQAEEVALRGLGLRDREMPAGEVGGAEVQHLALGDKGFTRLPQFFPRRVAVDVVELVQIHVVGLQAAQRRVDRAADVQGGKLALVGPVTHGAVQLGGDDRALAADAVAGEPGADDLLGAALAGGAAVGVGRVEEVDALVEGVVHDVVGGRLVGLGAEVHGAQAEAGDGKAGPAEVRVLHGDHCRT